MEQFVILIVGQGKLAQELLKELRSPLISQVLPWGDTSSVKQEPCMVVHAGSGRELNEVIGFCSKTGAPLLQLSTSQADLPAAPAFPLVLCPNVNMQMLSFMAMVKQAAKFFQGQDIRIVESHQATKKTTPGTAVYLAKSLGVSETAIQSVRDPKVQSEVLKIPAQFLDRHAYHEIVIHDAEVQIRLETRVLGKSAYAKGLAKVIEIVAHQKLAPGVHDVVDLVMACR